MLIYIGMFRLPISSSVWLLSETGIKNKLNNVKQIIKNALCLKDKNIPVKIDF